MSWLYVHEYVNVDTETRNCHLRNEGVPISNSEKLKSEKHTFLHSLCGANSDLGTFTSTLLLTICCEQVSDLVY